MHPVVFLSWDGDDAAVLSFLFSGQRLSATVARGRFYLS